MNDSKNTDLQRIGKALAILRQKVATVFEFAPNLREIGNLAEIPKEKAKVVEEQLWSIVAYGEYYVEKLMSDLSEPMLSLKNKRLFDWHRNTYKPFIKKIGELIDASSAPSREYIEKWIVQVKSSSSATVHLQSDIDRYMDIYEDYALSEIFKNRIKGLSIAISYLKAKFPVELPPDPHAGSSSSGGDTNAKFIFGMALDRCEDFLQDIEEQGSIDEDNFDRWNEWVDNLDICKNIIKQDYFNPDNWKTNSEDLFPVIVTDEMNKIPQHIQKRFSEIHSSFIYGNWMAVIALSRCLLEYALIHKKSLLEKRLRRKIEIPGSKGAAKDWKKDHIGIGERASIAGEAFPDLAESMEHVVEYGNYVMHPASRTIPGKNLAKHCFEEISKIISTLYSA